MTTPRPRPVWRRALRWTAALLGLGTLLTALGAAAAYWWVDQNILSTIPSDLSAYRDWRPLTSCRVSDHDGTIVDEFYVERRVWVDLDTLPDHVWQAFVSAEDRRFFQHPGVDLNGISRAVYANWQAGEVVQGGSTLTQQLVKNLLVGSEATYDRKLREAVLAYRLDNELGKRGVLELYLNYVALGSGNYGVEAASQDYFGMSAARLDPGQAALLAGLVPAPSRYSPRAHPDISRYRRRLVLAGMVRDGFLSDDVAAVYLDDPVVLPRRSTADKQAAAYLTLVRREVRRLFGTSAPFELGLKVQTALDMRIQLVAEKAVQDAIQAHYERQGPHPGREDTGPWAQGAAVVIENRTGRVLAATGGSETKLEGFIRAAQARRQPGSSFKPYVYAAALREGHSQLDTVTDAPINLNAGGGKIWSPKNYGGGFFGSLPMRSALAKSLNTVAVRLVLEVGPGEVAALAGRMGVRTPLRTDPTMALGSSEVTPLDQATGYATLARGGVTPELIFIDEVRDVDGELLGRAGDTLSLERNVTLPGGPGVRALDPAIAYETADMMRGVVRSGTARRAYVEGRDRAGKTGTTNDFLDAWFVGFTAEHTIAVWIGTDSVTTLGDKETGGTSALPAWLTIVEALGEADGAFRAAPPETVWAAWQGQWVALERGRPAGPKDRGAPPGPLPPFGGRGATAAALSPVEGPGR